MALRNQLPPIATLESEAKIFGVNAECCICAHHYFRVGKLTRKLTPNTHLSSPIYCGSPRITGDEKCLVTNKYLNAAEIEFGAMFNKKTTFSVF